MDDRFNILSQSLFQKSLESSRIEEIQSFTRQYPYFAPARFLLLKRLNPASEEYKALYQKALLYHHDPLSFEQWFHSGTEDDADVLSRQPGSVAPSPEEPEPIKEPAEAAGELAEAELPPVAAETPAELTGAEINVMPQDTPLPEPVETEAPVAEVMEQQQQKAESVEAGKIPEIASRPVSELTFEPFHTVDYFASQGIKLSQEEAPRDQLGKQLKSFTEWLKTMKRLPATELNKSVDVLAEKKVEHLAEDSVQTSEVFTEAMAEVWLHQGNYQKAIEIYNKLSLLNPSKRAYFASKIDSLKKSF